MREKSLVSRDLFLNTEQACDSKMENYKPTYQVPIDRRTARTLQRWHIIGKQYPAFDKMGACGSSEADRAPTVEDLFNPAFMVKMAVIQVKGMGDLLHTWMVSNKGNSNLLQPGSKRAKRYQNLLDHCNAAVKKFNETPEDVQGVMDILTDMQQFGAPPDEVVMQMKKRLGPGESLNFIEVDDNETAVVDNATIQAIRVARDEMAKTGCIFKKVLNAYLKRALLESIAVGADSQSSKSKGRDALSPKQTAKLTSLLAKAMSLPPAPLPGQTAKPPPPSEDDCKWQILPKLEEKTKLWDDEDMALLCALFDAPDAPNDLESFLTAGTMTIKEAVKLAVDALRKGCAAKKVVLDERVASKYHTKLMAQWHDANLSGEALVLAKNEQSNLCSAPQMTKEQLEGALVFIDLDLHSLPENLKAQDGFDNCRTALCKACANGQLDVAKKIFEISNDEDAHFLAQAGGYHKTVGEAWRRGMAAPLPLIVVPPLVECFSFTKDSDVAAKMGAELMMIHTQHPKLVVDGNGTTLLMASLVFPGIAKKLLRMDPSRDSICAVDKQGASILHKLAFITDSVEVAQAVLNMAAIKPIIRQTDMGKSTALMIAAYYGNNEYAKLLIAADPTKAHLTLGSFGTTPLGCSKGDLTHVIQTALDAAK